MFVIGHEEGGRFALLFSTYFGTEKVNVNRAC